jgi:LacI family transcriptional regulator
LIENGHRHIALITNAPLTYTSAQQRKSGYTAALEKVGIPLEEAWVRTGAYTPASGFRAMQELLGCTPPVTAVFVASDVVAIGALLAIKKAGLRVPEDIAVVGFDDIPLAEYFDPALTTIRLPAYGLGWAASERLIRLIRGEGLDQPEILVDPELIIRASSVSPLQRN